MARAIAFNAEAATPSTPYEITDTGLVVTAHMTFEQWAAQVQVYLGLTRNSMWWLGDLLIHGEHAFGEAAAQVINSYSAETAAAAIKVAERIDISRRLPDVSWSIHQAVAFLPPDDQDQLLARAAREHLKVRQVRELVREYKFAKKLGMDALPTADAAARRAVDALDAAVRGLDSVDWSLTTPELRKQLMVILNDAHHQLGYSIKRLPHRIRAERSPSSEDLSESNPT